MHRRFLRTAAAGSAVAASIAAVVSAAPAGAAHAASAQAASAHAASAPAAYVRVEGAHATLFRQTLVRTRSGNRVAGHACSAVSAAGALDDATRGRWSGSYSTRYGDYLVTAIEGEAPTANNYWTLWVNGRSSTTGACQTPLHASDHVLWFVCQGNPNPPYNCTNNPLAITAPAVARRGRRITAHVSQIDGAGHGAPMASATVRGRGVTGTSGSGGVVHLIARATGTIMLQARRPGATPSDPVYVCIYVHRRSECGRAGRGPAVHVAGIREHATFRRADAPRELHGTAGPDPSGLTDVSIGLRRRAPNGRCSDYDGVRARFRSAPCRKPAPLFSIGAAARWSYLLPHALGPGRYALDVIATDGANRQTRLVGGRSRIDFTVR